MVDFRKRLKKKDVVRKINPVEIYDSLDRRSIAGPLRSSQVAILTRWFEERSDKPNTIIKLHTGEGKTLIGLLTLQSKLNSGCGPCVFVCPNIYLAEQVKQEAIKFGIPYCDFSDGADLPDEFVLSKKILITHVQKVFNGKTKFGLRNKSVPIGAIVIDDSHACIDSIKNALTIKVDKDSDLYRKFFNLFKEDLREQGEGSFLELESGVYNTMLPVPYWSWIDKSDEATRILLDHVDEDEVAFVWPIIKDNIEECQAFLSGKRLEIAPTMTPIDVFGSFSRAGSRILMSATTQDDSFFIKGLNFDIESIENPLTVSDMKWSGEKMILIPSLVHDSLDRDTVINWMCKEAERNFGIVSLVPSFGFNQQYRNIGATVCTSKNIFETVQNLKLGNFDKACVFANRYDGIDLPDDACRILIIDSKPYFDSLIDRYEEDCRPTSDIINVKVAQKVEQGLGRSVRGEKDYSVIVVVGDLVKFVKSPLTSKYFSAQTKRQIEIGLQVAEYAVEESGEEKPDDTIASLINQVLDRDEAWKEFYSEEMDCIDDNASAKPVHGVMKLERDAEVFFKNGQYDKACLAAQKLCDSVQDDALERGWYLQNLARYKYRISKVESNSIQKSAFLCNRQLLKPVDGVTYQKLEYINQSRISRIVDWVKQFPLYEDLILAIDDILQNIRFGAPSDKFESSIQKLGESLGFLSQRPDTEIKKGPDNLWCGVDNFYFLIECKNEVEETRLEINKSEAGQMNSHCGWFEEQYGGADCKRIIVIPTKKLSYHGNFTHEVEALRARGIKLLSENVRGFYKEFARYNIHEIDDGKIDQFLNSHHLDIGSLKNGYSESIIRSNRP